MPLVFAFVCQGIALLLIQLCDIEEVVGVTGDQGGAAEEGGIVLVETGGLCELAGIGDGLLGGEALCSGEESVVESPSCHKHGRGG